MSCFKQSLFFIKYMQEYDQYHILSEAEFEQCFLEDWDGFNKYKENLLAIRQNKASQDLECSREQVDKFNINDDHIDVLLDSFGKDSNDEKLQISRSLLYEDLYASFRFVYQAEKVLDQMELEGISLDQAESLMTVCSMLQVSSTNVFLKLDDDFSFSKKYSICGDMYSMAASIYRKIHSICSSEGIDSGEHIQVTRFDRILNRLRCKYIRSSLMVLKMFLVFALLNVSPLYYDGVHKVSGGLIRILREVLFNKRIIQFVINGDFYGDSDKPHSTTRLYIYLAMGNSDRYCIRLDFPHQDEECIHLNLNHPGVKQSIGFPIAKNSRAIEDLKELDYFDGLFYESDDLYWFMHDFAKKVKAIDDSEIKKRLEDLLHVQAHIELGACDGGLDDVTKDDVTDFTLAFFEALNDYGIMPRMDGIFDNDRVYQYLLFEDYIYDVTLKLGNVEMNRQLGIGDDRFLKEQDVDYIANAVHKEFKGYIKMKFPYDDTLLNLADADMGYCDFIEKCLDRLDEMC